MTVPLSATLDLFVPFARLSSLIAPKTVVAHANLFAIYSKVFVLEQLTLYLNDYLIDLDHQQIYD